MAKDVEVKSMSVLVKWPEKQMCVSEAELQEAVKAVEAAFAKTLESLRVDIGLSEMVEKLYVPMCAWIVHWKKQKKGPLVLGINGAQGAGKSTLFNLLEVTLTEAFGLRVVGFSLDDLYKVRSEREYLSQSVHPLLKTRGVPGTHDVALGIEIIESLVQAEPTTVTKIPVFDKSIDDRCSSAVWQEWTGSADIIVFEGWCVGAIAQEDEALKTPVNRLEEEEDAEGVWRAYVNHHLKTDYAELFSKIDLMLMLQVPSMQSVFEWRSLQEKKLAERMRYIHDTQQPTDHLRIMDEEEIIRFIQHYERLTRFMLSEMPARADLTLRLNSNHKIDDIRINKRVSL